MGNAGFIPSTEWFELNPRILNPAPDAGLAFLPMTVEDAVDRKVFCFEHAPGVLAPGEDPTECPPILDPRRFRV